MPFSFFKLRQAAQDSIADLPALKHEAAQVAAQILHGAHGQRKAGGTEKFWQFREYNEVDRPQDIDWRQSAKAAHIFVREKELQTPQSVYFWAKNDNGMDFQSQIKHAKAHCSKAHAAQVLSLALAMLFQRADERVGVLGRERAGHSDAAIERIGSALIEPSPDALPDGLVPSRSGLVLCSDFLEPLNDIEGAFAPLAAKSRQGIVIQILDPAERDLPFDGRIIFENADQADYKIGNVASVREGYQKNFNTHIASLAKLCEGYGWMHIVHYTDQTFEATLLEIWEGVQR